MRVEWFFPGAARGPAWKHVCLVDGQAGDVDNRAVGIAHRTGPGIQLQRLGLGPGSPDDPTCVYSSHTYLANFFPQSGLHLIRNVHKTFPDAPIPDCLVGPVLAVSSLRSARADQNQAKRVHVIEHLQERCIHHTYRSVGCPINSLCF